MPLAGRAYLLFVAIVFMTMVTRVGWIDWQLIATVTATLATNLVIFLIAAALLIGIPVTILITFVDWLLGPAPESLTGEPPP